MRRNFTDKEQQITPLVCLIMKAIDSVVAFSAACSSAESGPQLHASMENIGQAAALELRKCMHVKSRMRGG